jgi:hypothetical protein
MKSNRKRTLLAPLFFLAGPMAIALVASGCVVETGPDTGDGAGGSCYPNLIIDYEIQNAVGGPVTCDGAGAVTIQATVDGVMFPAACPADSSAGSVIVPLQGLGTYNATINVYDRHGNALAPAQSSSFSIGSCGDTETQTPAILVVSPGTAG